MGPCPSKNASPSAKLAISRDDSSNSCTVKQARRGPTVIVLGKITDKGIVRRIKRLDLGENPQTYKVLS